VENMHFGTMREYNNGFTYTLAIKPNGFWSEAVKASVDKVGRNRWEGKIGTSSGGQERDYDPCKGARNQAYALIYASEWLDAKLNELNKGEQ